MTIPMFHGTRRLLAISTALLATAATAQTAAPAAAPVLESETAYTHKLPAPQPHWAFIRGAFDSGGTRIFDGDTGKMKGMIDTSKWSDMALDPTNSFYYVSETIWTKTIRGTRQDMVSIYDTVDLKLQAEVPMPGRLLIGERKNNFVISDDGKTGYVYNLSPASSVNVIDLGKRKFVQTVDLAGCASLMPNPAGGFSALCGDGTLATALINGKSATITHSAPFFSATNDPIFDNFVYDRGKRQATFLSYTGLITQATIGATPVIGDSWSIQAAAGVRPGDTKPLDVNWLPSGRQPLALHRASGHLYVLMHMGEYWTQKAPATEVWDVDLAARKVVKRYPLKKPVEHIEVTQDAKPLIFVNGENTTWVFDAKTFEQKFEMERAGGGLLDTVVGR